MDVVPMEVAKFVRDELESLAVADVWDHSCPQRHGYVDTGDAAWQMLEAALEPFHEDMLNYQRLSMPKQAEAVCLGILKGIYDFQWSADTEFKDWAVDAPCEFFRQYLEEWKTHFKQQSTTAKLQQFLTKQCFNWAEKAMRTVGVQEQG